MIRARVTKPAWSIGTRMYLEVEIDGRKMHLKVPFRYGRVTCKVLGLTPVQSLVSGEMVDISFDTRVWQGKDYKVLNTICSLHRAT